MIATIPYTEDPNEAIEYLSKYGHNLKYIRAGLISFNVIHFNCLVCESHIRLQALLPPMTWRVIVDDDGIENANYYCEKYRLLY